MRWRRLGGLIKQFWAETDIEAGEDLEELWQCWKTTLGPALADHTRLEGFRRGVLRVRVDSPVYRFELTQQVRTGLLKRLKKNWTKKTIRRIALY